MVEDEELTPVATIDLRGVRAALYEDDGDLVMLVDDGEVQIELNSGLAGTWEQAILGAERIASVATQYAEALRERRPVFTGPSPAAGANPHPAGVTRR